MQGYESYKDSGVEWLGEIPEHWNIVLGFKCLTEDNQLNIGNKEKTVLSLSYGQIVIKPEEKLTGLVPESFATYQIVEPNDIVIRTMDLQNDKTSLRTGISKHKGIITSAYLKIRPRQEYNANFLHYVLHTFDVMKIFYAMGSGLRQNLSFKDFKRLKLAVPQIEEQNRIVTFIDQKNAEIDDAITKKQRLIELLKEQKAILINQAVTKGLNPNAPMRDSGINGIGLIPKHWLILYNRRIFREKGRKITNDNELPLSLSQVDGVIPSSEMKERSLKPAHYKNFKLCYPKDLIVNRFKGHLGVLFESQYRGIVTFHYGVFTPERDVNTKYFEHLYHIEVYKGIYAGASNGMTIGLQNLSNQNFYDVKSVFPPKLEQDAIVKYIGDISLKSQDVIDKTLKEIDFLKEFKQTLIAHAVTGKIKV